MSMVCQLSTLSIHTFFLFVFRALPKAEMIAETTLNEPAKKVDKKKKNTNTHTIGKQNKIV